MVCFNMLRSDAKTAKCETEKNAMHMQTIMQQQGFKNSRKLLDYNVPGGTEDAQWGQYVSEAVDGMLSSDSASEAAC